MNAPRKLKPLLILLLSSSIWLSCKREARVFPPIKVPFVVVENKDVPIYAEFAAQTFGDLDIDLTVRVDGIVTGIYFKEGQQVKKDQLLYTIDPLQYDTKVDQARGQVSASESNLVNAQEELNRIRPLAKINAISIRDLDAAVAREKAASSNLESAKAVLRNQQIERSYCNILSPVDGVIGISIARLGDYVSRIGASSKLNTVSKLDYVRVRFAVSESAYLKYQKRQKNIKDISDVELLLSDGSVHSGKGKMNFSDASIDPTTGTMTIEAQFPNPDRTLRSGQFAKVRLKVDTAKDAIVVPQKAIGELQGIYQVNVITPDNKIEVRVVKVGAKVGKEWVVTKGLKSGDRVAIIGSLFIQPGSTIAPVPYVADVLNANPTQTK